MFCWKCKPIIHNKVTYTAVLKKTEQINTELDEKNGSDTLKHFL